MGVFPIASVFPTCFLPANSMAGQGEGASTTTPQLPGTFRAVLTSFTQQSFQVEMIIPF